MRGFHIVTLSLMAFLVLAKYSLENKPLPDGFPHALPVQTVASDVLYIFPAGDDGQLEAARLVARPSLGAAMEYAARK